MDKRLPILKLCQNGLKVGINYQCLEVTLKLIHPDQYLEHLAEMGDRFTKRGADPDKTNGNSINQVRTNEFVLLPRVWQFREFNLLDRNDSRIKKFSITADRDLKSKGTLGGQAGLWTTTTKGNPMVNEFRDHSNSRQLDKPTGKSNPGWRS